MPCDDVVQQPVTWPVVVDDLLLVVLILGAMFLIGYFIWRLTE